jgi:RNA polymerase sigma-70 factor, ECF subfamily
MTDTDPAVVGSLRGSQAAMADLYHRHHPMALRTATAILGDVQAAEEACQEAFLRAFDTLRRKHAGVAFSTWLYRYVVWEARSWARRRRRQPPPSEAAEEVGSTADVERAELRMQLVAAMQELPIELREVVTLRFYLDLPIDEVARIVGCRAGTVKSRAHRALRRLARSGHISIPDDQVTGVQSNVPNF